MFFDLRLTFLHSLLYSTFDEQFQLGEMGVAGGDTQQTVVNGIHLTSSIYKADRLRGIE